MISAANDQTHILFEEYIRVRNVKFSREEFSYLISLYPSLLICMCDGKLDQQEWDGLKTLAESLAEEFSNENLAARDKEQLSIALLTEFRYLLDHSDKWSKKFLNALQDHLSMNPEEKEFILETMYLFANSADGISEIEQQTINNLNKRLSLAY